MLSKYNIIILLQTQILGVNILLAFQLRYFCDHFHVLQLTGNNRVLYDVFVNVESNYFYTCNCEKYTLYFYYVLVYYHLSSLPEQRKS